MPSEQDFLSLTRYVEALEKRVDKIESAEVIVLDKHTGEMVECPIGKLDQLEEEFTERDSHLRLVTGDNAEDMVESLINLFSDSCTCPDSCFLHAGHGGVESPKKEEK